MPPSKIGFYGHVRQYHDLKAEIDQAIQEMLESGSYVLGPQLAKFEEELARYLKVEEAVGVNSGTDALLLVNDDHRAFSFLGAKRFASEETTNG